MTRPSRRTTPVRSDKARSARAVAEPTPSGALGSGGPFEAQVTATGEALLARRTGKGASRKAFPVRNAAPGYVPCVGDRVLVLEGEAAYVVGVLRAAAIAASDGARAVARDGAIELRDPTGALVATWDPAERRLVVAAADGDLHLGARGKVRIEAGTDLELVSGATARLEASVLETTTHRASIDTGEASVRAKASRLDAETHTVQAGRLEVAAQRLFEAAGEAYREVEGLLQQRAGRTRTLVKETFRVLAGRTDIASREDTVIDGKRVLLG